MPRTWVTHERTFWLSQVYAVVTSVVKCPKEFGFQRKTGGVKCETPTGSLPGWRAASHRPPDKWWWWSGEPDAWEVAGFRSCCVEWLTTMPSPSCDLLNCRYLIDLLCQPGSRFGQTNWMAPYTRSGSWSMASAQ